MTEHERFEAWCVKVHLCDPSDDLVWLPERNCYQTHQIHFAWQAWQAALAQRTEQEPCLHDWAFDVSGNWYCRKCGANGGHGTAPLYAHPVSQRTESAPIQSIYDAVDALAQRTEQRNLGDEIIEGLEALKARRTEQEELPPCPGCGDPKCGDTK